MGLLTLGPGLTKDKMMQGAAARCMHRGNALFFVQGLGPGATLSALCLPGWTRAHAAVLIHPNSTGAGRLRQLMRTGTQTVRFAAPPDVASKIRAASGLAPGAPIGAMHVMVWVVGNTAAALQSGVLEWAEQVRERWGLDDLWCLCPLPLRPCLPGALGGGPDETVEL